MKTVCSYLLILTGAVSLSLPGCATSGTGTENIRDDRTGQMAETRTDGDTLQVDGGEVEVREPTSNNTVSDTGSDTTATATTISGSTEHISALQRRINYNTILVNGDASLRLDDYIGMVAGVRRSGYGGRDVSFQIRGPGSIRPCPPLFVIDGFKFGRNYGEIYDYVDLNRVKQIQVLKGPDAAMYGSWGGCGVIVITEFKAGDFIE